VPDEFNLKDISPAQPDAQYRITGEVFYGGDGENGHYTANAWCEDDRWHTFNDAASAAGRTANESGQLRYRLLFYARVWPRVAAAATSTAALRAAAAATSTAAPCAAAATSSTAPRVTAVTSSCVAAAVTDEGVQRTSSECTLDVTKNTQPDESTSGTEQPDASTSDAKQPVEPTSHTDDTVAARLAARHAARGKVPNTQEPKETKGARKATDGGGGKKPWRVQRNKVLQPADDVVLNSDKTFKWVAGETSPPTAEVMNQHKGTPALVAATSLRDNPSPSHFVDCTQTVLDRILGVGAFKGVRFWPATTWATSRFDLVVFHRFQRNFTCMVVQSGEQAELLFVVVEFTAQRKVAVIAPWKDEEASFAEEPTFVEQAKAIAAQINKAERDAGTQGEPWAVEICSPQPPHPGQYDFRTALNTILGLAGAPPSWFADPVPLSALLVALIYDANAAFEMPPYLDHVVYKLQPSSQPRGNTNYAVFPTECGVEPASSESLDSVYSPRRRFVQHTREDSVTPRELS
jgi:hypothetical protein